MPDEMRVHDAFHVRDIQRARHVRGDPGADQARRPDTESVSSRKRRCFAESVSPASAVLRRRRWWLNTLRLRHPYSRGGSCGRVRSNHARQHKCRWRSAFQRVPRSRRQHQPCAQRQRQWRSCALSPSSFMTAVASSKDVAAPLSFNCCCGSRGVAATPLVDCCWSSKGVTRSLSKMAVTAEEWFRAGPFVERFEVLSSHWSLRRSLFIRPVAKSPHTREFRLVFEGFAAQEARDQVN